MVHCQLVVRGGVAASGEPLEVAVDNGRIVAIGPELGERGAQEIAADGLFVLPGGVDPHVHFNEPGRTEWEGWASGSRALIAGGVTTCVEMPLNAHPPTLDRASFEAKAAAASGTSWADFALWGGLTPTNLGSLEELAASGVMGFKAFMSASGTDDFQHAGDDTLYHGMQVAASLQLPVAVHAENDAITADLARRAQAEGRTGMRDYLASRPVVAEVEAIGRAIALAEATGCALHVVHVSTGMGVALVAEARGRGVDVTCETCPHYLAFDEADVERLGALAKCAPPIRSIEVRESLWNALMEGDVDMITSDHSPAPPSMKTGENAFDIWGGITGCQHLMMASLTMADDRDLDLTDVVRMLTISPAQRFDLSGKGELAVGADADLVLWRRQEATPLPMAEYRHPASAWDGYPMTYQVSQTMLRGELVWRDGQTVGSPRGQLLTPGARR